MPADKKLTAKQELATVRRALQGVSERLVTLGEERAALALEYGPRCVHSIGTPDDRNQALLRRQARIAKMLTKYRIEREDFAAQQAAFYAQAQAWRESQAKREDAAWHDHWKAVQQWQEEHGIPDEVIRIEWGPHKKGRANDRTHVQAEPTQRGGHVPGTGAEIDDAPGGARRLEW